MIGEYEYNSLLEMAVYHAIESRRSALPYLAHALHRAKREGVLKEEVVRAILSECRARDASPKIRSFMRQLGGLL